MIDMVGEQLSFGFLRLLTLMLAVVSLLSACGGGTATPPAQAISAQITLPVAPEAPSIGFADVTPSSGLNVTVGFDIETKNAQNEVATIFTSGVAAGDYDNDGDIDLFIVRGNLAPNLLFRNDGAMLFTNVSAEAGVGVVTGLDGENVRHGSPTFADIDGDGDLDLLIGGLYGDPVVVLSNRGDGTFDDVSASAGFADMTAEFTHSPSFGDYDRDGDLDVIFGHWGTVRTRDDVGDTEHLWRNDSDGSEVLFTSVSIEAGLSPSILVNEDPLREVTRSEDVIDLTFSPSFALINEDLWPDILMVADINSSQVFLNKGDGSFRNATDYGEIVDGNGMGSALGDFDDDGDLDWFVSSIKANNFPPSQLSEIGNRLYRNDQGTFTDITDEAGVADGGWGWGSCFADLDNNGDIDIYHTNGWFQFDEHGGFTTDESRVFISNGQGAFIESADQWGLNDQEQGRGIVCADFDNDGDLDILQLHSNATNAVTLWENETENNSNYVILNLVGRGKNSQAVGAKIKMTLDGEDYYRDVLLSSNFASHNPTRQHFGIGDNDIIDRILVTWPDGTQSTLSAVESNQILTISQ